MLFVVDALGIDVEWCKNCRAIWGKCGDVDWEEAKMEETQWIGMGV